MKNALKVFSLRNIHFNGLSCEGAINRAKSALKLSSGDFGVGLEGGLHQIGERWFESGWIAVVDKQGTIGLGSSGRFEVSLKVK